MPKRGRFGLRPGLGIYRADVELPEAKYMPSADPIMEAVFDAVIPAEKGVPSNPRVRAWKKKVMKAGWTAAIRYIRQGMNPTQAFRKGLTTAYHTIPKPGRRARRYSY